LATVGARIGAVAWFFTCFDNILHENLPPLNNSFKVCTFLEEFAVLVCASFAEIYLKKAIKKVVQKLG